MALCVVITAPGCGTSGSGDSTSRVVRVTLQDFKIEAPGHVKAGTVDLVVRNAGPTDHELLLVHGDGARLPFRPDGLTVDEDPLERKLAEAIEPFASGTTETIRASLVPGRYVLLCNMSGHYLGGMRAELVVEP